MNEQISLRMARAYPEQIQTMREWLDKIKEMLDTDYSFDDIGQFVVATFESRRIDEYERILLGYETLIENVCDQSLSYLELKPEILSAMAVKK